MNMSQSYIKSCLYCDREIVMSDRLGGNWYPYNPDGTPHDCRNQTQTGTKKIETKSLTLEVIEVRLRRLESIVIHPRK